MTGRPTLLGVITPEQQSPAQVLRFLECSGLESHGPYRFSDHPPSKYCLYRPSLNWEKTDRNK